MMNEKPHVVILGAGVCGLYAALTVLREGGAVTLLEKEPVAGGLAAGHQRGTNFYDLGVHMLHAFDQEIFDDCVGVMADERCEVELDARIKWAGNHYHYPLRGRDILRGMPPLTLARCLLGLAVAEVRGRFARVDDQDAEEALISLYGAPLYEFFFEDFTHRYWELHPRQLSAEFIRSKMPRLSAVDVVKNLLQKCHLGSTGDRAEGALRFETLHYSETGAETLPRTLAAEVKRLGGVIHLNAEVTEVRCQGDQVEELTWRAGGAGSEKVGCDHCLSTIPLPDLIQKMTPSPSVLLLQQAGYLRYKPMVVYGLLVKKPRCMEALYTYYRDCLFHRVGEPKNAGLKVTPEGHTVLIVEMTCELGDRKWKGDDEIYQGVLSDLEQEGLCRPDEVVERHLLKARHAYPIFSKGFGPHLDALQTYLAGFINLSSTGRQGGFTYPNMHRVMRMGKNSALDLLGRLSS